MARLLDLQPSDRILDLGCGSGIKSVAALNQVNPIVGIDVIKPSRVHFPGSNATYVQGDARDLTRFADRSFEVVISIGLLEHLSDTDATTVMRESRRLARRSVHVVPHRYGSIEPHVRLPFFALWPRALQQLVRWLRRRGREGDEWHEVYWRSRRTWIGLASDSSVRVLDHWYGPLLMYYIILWDAEDDRT